MGQTALLPLRRKACCGFFLPEKFEKNGESAACLKYTVRIFVD
jgi:hypothetical protein